MEEEGCERGRKGVRGRGRGRTCVRGGGGRATSPAHQ